MGSQYKSLLDECYVMLNESKSTLSLILYLPDKYKSSSKLIMGDLKNCKFRWHTNTLLVKHSFCTNLEISLAKNMNQIDE